MICPIEKETCAGCYFVKEGLCDYPYCGQFNIKEITNEVMAMLDGKPENK